MLNTLGLGAAIVALALYGLWTPDLERAELEKRYVASKPQIIEVDGLQVHYKATGPEGAPALLLLHGFGSSLQAWDDWSVKLEQKYRVIRLDLPGFGLTGASPANDYSEEKDLATLTHFADKLGLEKFSVMGHSMGGKTAMLFAANHPERIEKLIVADIGPKFYPQHHQSILEGLNAVDFSLKPSRSEVEEILSKYISDFGTRQFLLKSLYWVEPGQLAFRFNLAVFNKQIDQIGTALPENARFEKPSLFIRGGNSNYILDSDFEAIKQHFPKVAFETIPNVGHWLHAENPKLFYEISSSFLK